MKEIQLSQGKVALVNDEDFEWLNQWKWCAAKRGQTFYATRLAPGRKGAIHMHQLLVGNGTQRVDHKDGNGLNNQRLNLRPATHQQNMFNQRTYKNNTSGYKGVTWQKDCGKWRAQIGMDGKKQYLGLFTNPEDAACAYDAKASELFGKFARLNFPQEGQNDY